MVDPLAQVIALLQPRGVVSKVIAGAGTWAVRYATFGKPSFCTMLEGQAVLSVDGAAPVTLQAGDFVLLPATPAFTLSSGDGAVPVMIDPAAVAEVDGEVRHGRRDGPPDMRMLGGYFAFDAPDAGLLVALLPPLLHLREHPRLPVLVQLVREESVDDQPGRDLVLARLVEVLLIAAIRSTAGADAPPGLLRGLADPRLAVALRHLHGDPAGAWTVDALAHKAALSRSAFFQRFQREVGVTPMAYLLAWRMALARDLLGRQKLGIAAVAAQVGYGSASSFSTAFSRHAGCPPGEYGRRC